MKESLQKALDALGPTPPDCCGCQTEWQIAIDAIKAALEAPQRTWVGLKDEEIVQMGLSNYIKVVRETEAKLKERNT